MATGFVRNIKEYGDKKIFGHLNIQTRRAFCRLCQGGTITLGGQAAGAIDVAIALEHISLAATELGLGTCWIGSFETQKVREILNIPEDVAIIELMAVGCPADGGRQSGREPIENIACYDQWRF